MLKEVTIQLKTNLIVNDYAIPLNDFTQNYIGNILRGIVLSLGYNSKNVTINIGDSELNISTDNGKLHIIKDFVRLLIESTIKGVLSPLKGVIWSKKIIISCEEI